MSVIAVLIGISLLVAAGFLVAFFWAVKSGQYNDTYTPSVRILFDDKNNSSEIVPRPKGEGQGVREKQAPNGTIVNDKKKKENTKDNSSIHKE